MLRTIFDKDGLELVGLVLSLIVLACMLAVAFYVFL